MVTNSICPQISSGAQSNPLPPSLQLPALAYLFQKVLLAAQELLLPPCWAHWLKLLYDSHKAALLALVLLAGEGVKDWGKHYLFYKDAGVCLAYTSSGERMWECQEWSGSSQIIEGMELQKLLSPSIRRRMHDRLTHLEKEPKQMKMNSWSKLWEWIKFRGLQNWLPPVIGSPVVILMWTK